ncbi:FecCD family ABC transporter permease [Planosporangium sp. 12N6]|uniref:FecCD family ABC transporter permease n=1 Tax=Planosporangium spinosum TaxID=3402278 RepID=UPI003CF0784E
MRVLRVSGWLALRFRTRALAVGAGCALAALGLGVLAIGSGDYPMGPVDVVRTLAGAGTPTDAFIVNELRLPRVVTALLAGAALALSGAVLQAVVRNPLGSPDLLGFTRGAATGALTAIVVVGGGALALSAGAVAGGLAAAAAIYALAWRRGLHGYRLVLVGIGADAILAGVDGYLLTRADITDAARAVRWLTGSLDGCGWDDAWALLAVLAVTVPVVLVGCGPALRILELGDDAAHALGVRVEPLRLVLVTAAVLLSAAAAAACGPVAFVALTAPQLARRLARGPGPNLLASLGMGAVLLVAADLAGQRLVPGHQLAAGVLTGALGGGYLVWLLAAQRRAGRL